MKKLFLFFMVIIIMLIISCPVKNIIDDIIPVEKDIVLMSHDAYAKAVDMGLYIHVIGDNPDGFIIDVKSSDPFPIIEYEKTKGTVTCRYKPYKIEYKCIHYTMGTIDTSDDSYKCGFYKIQKCCDYPCSW